MRGQVNISPDGKYLFFSYDRDIWWVDIQVIEKLRPKNTLPPIVIQTLPAHEIFNAIRSEDPARVKELVEKNLTS